MWGAGRSIAVNSHICHSPFALRTPRCPSRGFYYLPPVSVSVFAHLILLYIVKLLYRGYSFIIFVQTTLRELTFVNILNGFGFFFAFFYSFKALIFILLHLEISVSYLTYSTKVNLLDF